MNLALTGSGLKQGAQTFRGVSPPLCAGERREHDGAQPGGAGGHAAQHQAGGERPPAGGAAGRPPAAGAGTHHPSLCSLPLSDPPMPHVSFFSFIPHSRVDFPTPPSRGHAPTFLAPPLSLSSLLTQGCRRKSHSQGAAAPAGNVRSCRPATLHCLPVDREGEGVTEVKARPVTRFLSSGGGAGSTNTHVEAHLKPGGPSPSPAHPDPPPKKHTHTARPLIRCAALCSDSSASVPHTNAHGPLMTTQTRSPPRVNSRGSAPQK